MVGIKSHFESQVPIGLKIKCKCCISVPNQSKNNKNKTMGKDIVENSSQSKNGNLSRRKGRSPRLMVDTIDSIKFIPLKERIHTEYMTGLHFL